MSLIDRARLIFGRGSQGVAASDDLSGHVLDAKYRIERKIGTGAFGTVWLGHHVALDRPLAVKVLHAELAGSQSAAAHLAFETEARLTSKVSHPNSVSVFDFGYIDNTQPYLVMEYLDGKPLSTLLSEQPHSRLTPEHTFDIVQQIAGALAAAHSIPLVHLDLKPDNIMLVHDNDGSSIAKLVDFGISRLVEASHADSDDGAPVVAGTPGFMAPEQAMCMPTDARADIYALGACVYQMLAGQGPWPGARGLTLVRKQCNEPPYPLLNAAGDTVSKELDRVVMKCLAADSDVRYGSVLEFLADFRRAVFGQLPQAGTERRPGVIQFSMAEVLAAADAAEADLAAGNHARCYERLNRLIVAGVVDPQIIHLATLALCESGATEFAAEFHARYKHYLPPTEEYRALEGRLLKDRARSAAGEHRIELMRRARETYLEIHNQSAGVYSGINAASLSALLGDEDEARRLAQCVLDDLDQAGSDDYWSLATRGEACLILGQDAAAATAINAAAAHPQATLPARRTTRRQLELVCRARNVDPGVFGPLQAPYVLHCAIAQPAQGRVTRFASDEAARSFAGQVQRAIAQRDVGEVVTSMETEFEIEIAEQALAAGCELTLVLPCSAPALQDHIRSRHGRSWATRLADVMERAADITVAGDSGLSAGLQMRNAMDAVAVGRTLMRVAELGARGVVQCVFGFDANQRTHSYTDTAAIGSTEFSDISALAGPLDEARETAAAGGHNPVYACLVHVRALGIQALNDAELLVWEHEFAQTIARVAADAGSRVIAADPGDGHARFILEDGRTAISVARALVSDTARSTAGAGVAVFGHAGLVTQVDTASGPRFIGRCLHKLAAMSHDAAPGSLYLSDVLAAMVSADPASGVDAEFTYAGEIRLPDGFGLTRLYSLDAAHA